MKAGLLFWFVLLVFSVVSYGEPTTFSQDDILQVIQKNLPPNWQIVEKSPNEIPHGHYWGMDYKGPKGLKVVVQGPKDVTFRWRDHEGKTHDIAIAKESLDLWIMPPEYGESWKRHFVFHRPIPARLIASGEVGKVYGFQTHRIIDKTEFKDLLKQASETSWPNSPHDEKAHLSWEYWQRDLGTVLKNVIKKP
jgi:hypothetical protein